MIAKYHMKWNYKPCYSQPHWCNLDMTSKCISHTLLRAPETHTLTQLLHLAKYRWHFRYKKLFASLINKLLYLVLKTIVVTTYTNTAITIWLRCIAIQILQNNAVDVQYSGYSTLTMTLFTLNCSLSTHCHRYVQLLDRTINTDAHDDMVHV